MTLAATSQGAPANATTSAPLPRTERSSTSDRGPGARIRGPAAGCHARLRDVGTLDPDGSNAVLIQHALTGDTHVTRGASEEPGWWEQLAGPGAPVDTDRYFVVSINILGGCYGSTGPSTPAPDGRPWGSRFPLVTLRDTTAAEARLADALGIRSWYAVLGGSLGGARALEWAVSYPERVRRCGVFPSAPAAPPNRLPSPRPRRWPSGWTPTSAGATTTEVPSPRRASPWPGGSRTSPIARPPNWSPLRPEAPGSGGSAGSRFPRRPRPLPGGKLPRPPGQQAGPPLRREQLHRHHRSAHEPRICRGRGPLAEALAPATAEFLVAAVDSDRLGFRPSPVNWQRPCRAARKFTSQAPIGHDGFLTEIGQLSGQLRETFFG